MSDAVFEATLAKINRRNLFGLDGKALMPRGMVTRYTHDSGVGRTSDNGHPSRR